MEAQKDLCPWCGSEISHEHFQEIEDRIRVEERERLSKAELEMKKRLEDANLQELEVEKHKVELKLRRENGEKLAALAAERESVEAKVKELESRESAMRAEVAAEADRLMNSELAKASEKHQKELEDLRLSEQASRENVTQQLVKRIDELASQNSLATEQIAAVAAERDSSCEQLKALQARESQARAEMDELVRQRVAASILEMQENEKRMTEEFGRKLAALTTERDQSVERLSKAEQERAEIGAQSESAHQAELSEQRTLLEQHHATELLKKDVETNRVREELQAKLQALQHQLANKTANELGELSEADLFESLREAFPDDNITRIGPGKAGADIKQEVRHDGLSCGEILYDSKNRQAWRNEYVTKLRQDQLAVEAKHAILTTTKFPFGQKELCIESEIVVVHPSRAVFIAEILRSAMVRMHLACLSNEDRGRKTAQIYTYITSDSFLQRMSEASKLSEELLELEVDEKKAHDKMWKTRGTKVTRLKNTIRDVSADVSAIVGGVLDVEHLDDNRPCEDGEHALEMPLAMRLPR